VWTYGAHDLPITATDSGGESRTSRHTFVACDFEGLDINLILGYPWLADIDPTLGFRTGIWQYAKLAAGIEVLGPEEFYQATGGKGVYRVVVRDRPGRIATVSASTTRTAATEGIP
jgi:hypothetical protein